MRRTTASTLLLALVENVAREELSPVEEARAYAVLVDEFDLSLGEVAERVGRSKPAVSNRLRLLDLPDDVLWMLERGELTRGPRARGARRCRTTRGAAGSRRRIVRAGLSVRAAEKAARCAGARAAPRRKRKVPVDPALAERAASPRSAHGPRGAYRLGRLELQFADETELAELAEALETASHP